MDASDDMEDMFVTPDVRARRRRLHTEAEQRRRDAIKRGFDNLLELIHPVKADPGSSLIRMSKATILNRSISLILRLAKQKSQKRMEIETLQNKVKALQILNS
ncbi:hypothetical protein SprV_0100209400 [Sparganum proliferum]|nr:unnamed protein product [Spirometra erinaceieuropaei]